MKQPVLRIILGVHQHIPWGAKDREFEARYTRILKPFITNLYTNPSIPAALHYSGVLLNWIERVHPEFCMILGELAARKQVEFIGGGFYEPLMPLVPVQDIIGQIELYTTYIRKQFGKRPLGCRLPAFAWEQHLVGPLTSCGMIYTFLDETQFAAAGVPPLQPCITEDQGKTIAVLPVASQWENQETAEAHEPAAFGNTLESWLNEGEAEADTHRVLCIFPDQVFRTGGEDAFQRFFTNLLPYAADPRIEFTMPSRFLKARTITQKVYFPNSLAEPRLCQEVASPRQFLIEFPEANSIYAKMMFTRLRINQLRGDKSRKRIALEELWKAQGYDLFCPRVQEGVFRHDIRKAAYRALLGAEKITRENAVFVPALMSFDFDLDGENEYLLQNENWNCYLTCRGASVFELDYIPRAWNYLDTFSHPPSTGRRRTAFSDWMIPFGGNLDVAAFPPPDPLPPGTRAWGEERFELVKLNRERLQVLFRCGPSDEATDGYGALELDKEFHLERNALTVRYGLTNQGRETVQGTLIPGVDVSFAGDGEDALRVLRIQGGEKELVTQGQIAPAEGLKFQDLKNEAILLLTVEGLFEGRIQSIVSSGMYQSTWVAPLIPVTLAPGDRYETSLTLRMYD